MDAWGQAHKAENKVKLLADTNAELTKVFFNSFAVFSSNLIFILIKALGLTKDLAVLGGVRSQRYTLVIEDNVVKHAFIEPDGTGLSCSLADNVIKNL
jgi:2-Cys peroxiredoxin 5